jgi:hypothetical protein
LLRDPAGDVIAYFEFNGDSLIVSADIRGRHCNCEEQVVSILQRLARELGGELTADAGLVDEGPGNKS